MQSDQPPTGQFIAGDITGQRVDQYGADAAAADVLPFRRTRSRHLAASAATAAAAAAPPVR